MFGGSVADMMWTVDEKNASKGEEEEGNESDKYSLKVQD
jgi:hypothetical protein